MSRRDTALRYYNEQKELTETRVNSGIELYRKGNVNITVKDKDGNLVKGAKVFVNHKNHEFRFGANIFMLDEFECEEKNVKYYIVTVARNHAIDFLKRKRLDVILNDEYVYNYKINLDNNESSVIAFIKRHLDDLEAEIIINHIAYENNFNEIAENLDLSVNTVKTKYYRSIKKLRKEMRDYDA